MQFEDHQYYNCEITLDSGATHRISANWMHNNNLDNFQGWRCTAGQLRLSIDKDLNVWSGQCENDFLGHALTGFDVFDQPTVCRRSRCTGCTDDLLISKQANYE